MIYRHKKLLASSVSEIQKEFEAVVRDHEKLNQSILRHAKSQKKAQEALDEVHALMQSSKAVLPVNLTPINRILH